jgi:hypothetical protein
MISTGSALNFGHFNARSIPRHIDDISDIIGNSPLDVCGVSETFLNENCAPVSFEVPGFSILRNDRFVRGGGGVAIYLRSHLKTKMIAQSVRDDPIEYLFIELRVSQRKILFGVIYNPPPSNNKIQLLGDIFSDICSRYSDIVFCGDLNINLLRNTCECKRLKSIANNFSLHILKLDPTCHSPISPESSLIDYLIVCNRSRVLKHGQVSVPSISEHDLLYFSY